MEREQIIKALECCSKDDCDNCPNGFGNCYSNLAKDALAIIESQEQRIKELTEENERLHAEITHLEGHREADIKAFKTLRDDTVRKMQERLKAKMNDHPKRFVLYGIFDAYYLVSKSFIDQIAKEMLEGE